MPEVLIHERTEDFLQKVMDAIAAGDIDGAVEMFEELTETKAQLDALAQLANYMPNFAALASTLALASALARARNRARALARARVLASARVRARALVRALELARVLDLDLNLTRVLDLDRALDLDLDLSLASAHFRARAFDLELANVMPNVLTYARELASDNVGREDTQQVIVRVLDRLIEEYRSEENKMLLEEGQTEESSDERVALTFAGIEVLTPQTIGNYMVPYLQAIFDLQRIIDELQGDAVTKPRIISISQHSPPEVEMEGTEKAIEVLKKDIVPIRNELTRELTERDSAIQKNADAQQKNALKRTQANSEASNEVIKAQARKINAESEKLEAEAAEIRANTTLKILEKTNVWAIRIVERFSSNVPDDAKRKFVAELQKLLQEIVENPLYPIDM